MPLPWPGREKYKEIRENTKKSQMGHKKPKHGFMLLQMLWGVIHDFCVWF